MAGNTVVSELSDWQALAALYGVAMGGVVESESGEGERGIFAQAEVRYARSLRMDRRIRREAVEGRSVLILASGEGSNFEALVQSLRPWGVRIAGLFCDRVGAGVVSRAERLGVAYHLLSREVGRDREAREEALWGVLEREAVDAVLLAGYRWILSKRVVEAWGERMINLHPSLLPDYKGLGAMARAYADAPLWMGVSLHRVVEAVDAGGILCQGRFALKAGASLSQVEAQIHALEHTLFPWLVLAWLACGGVGSEEMEESGGLRLDG